MAVLKLTSPWVTYYRELNELFKQDEEIKIIYDEENNVVKLFVNNAEKAEAISSLLPVEKSFGNVTLTISVIPPNGLLKAKAVDYEKAFEGNPIVSYIKTISLYMTNDLTYIVFKNKVVQYFNDDLGDINGVCSTLYQDIAKRVFDDKEGIYFCTGIPNHQ